MAGGIQAQGGAPQSGIPQSLQQTTQVAPEMQQQLNSIAGADLPTPTSGFGGGMLGIAHLKNNPPAMAGAFGSGAPTQIAPSTVLPISQQPAAPPPPQQPSPPPQQQPAAQPPPQPQQVQQPMGYGNYHAQPQQYQQPYYQPYYQPYQQPYQPQQQNPYQQQQNPFYRRPQSYSPYGFTK
jgi:hypothetical protein